MKLKCIIIDDEPVARKVIAEFVGEIEYLELTGQAEDPLKAMRLLDNNEIDIIFLDINMPKMKGNDFLKNVKTQASIIMTTAYPEYAAEAYGLDVLDYLVKPIAFDRFFKACNKAKEAIAVRKMARATASAPTGAQAPAPIAAPIAAPIPNGADDHFFIKCNNQIEKVLYEDLLYAEAKLNYVMLYTGVKQMMVYVTIKGLEEQLPADLFIKVHKSFIVNRRKIKSIEGNVLDMGNVKITISQGLREKVIDEITRGRIIKR